MALAASRTLLALFLTFCAPGCGLTAERLVRPRNVKGATVDEGVRDSWEPSIHLDGTPVDRFAISTGKPTRSHRFTKAGKGSRSHLLEDVDPEWVNLDGFAVLGGAPVSNSSAGTARYRTPSVSRSQPSSVRAPRGDRTTHPLGVSSARMHRRAPQSSSGPRQPERLMAGASLLERRRQFHTKPQSDQRKRNVQKLTSESVHVVSLQAQKTPSQSTPAKMAVATKTTTPEPPEYVAQDISVRVMSPQSVLVSWVDPVVEMGKATAGETRSYTVRFREKGESARWEYKESTQRRILIDTLMADSMYEFAVRISEGGNEGKWSISVFQRTPESAPSGPPENFEVKPVRGKGTAVKATWDPPEEPNGRIREYILSYAPAMKPFGMKSVTYRGSTTTATIDGLTPGDRYIFKIRATNRRGQGPQSKAFSVAMPGSSRSTPSITKTEDNSKLTKKLSKQETHQDESDLESTEEPEEPTTTPEHRPAAPASRRVRPLSQTRSYHSIFNSLRGSVRNPANRGFSRGRGEDSEDEEEEEEEEQKEEEEEEEETPATTPATEETTTVEVVPETKEPENIISYDAEDVGYDREPLTTEIPSLKVLTPSPTKASTHPQRRPIKIRVHQKPDTKASSSSTSLSTPSSPSSSDSQSSSSTTSLSTSSHNQGSAAGRRDPMASKYPESKDTYDKPSITHTKPATPVVKHPNSQQTEATSESKGSASSGRTNGAGFGSRYGNGRRFPFLRGNSSRILNGYKPIFTSQSNVPRTSSQAASKTHGSATSQSTLPDRTREHKPSQSSDSTTPKTTLPGETHSQGKPDVRNFEKSQSVSEPKTRGSTPLHTSQSSSNHPSTIDTSASSSLSVPHGRSHSSAASHDKQSSHISPEQDTAITGTNNDYKNTNTDEYKVERPTSSSISKPTEHERSNKEEREETSKERPVSPRTRISQSFAERFPWLASRYPGRFGSGTRVPSTRPGGRTTASRTSSSIGADTPILRGTAPRFSGATGTSGVSRIQETTEDITNPSSSDDSIKNGARLGSGKSSLTNQNTASGGPRNPGSSSSISTSSSAATPSKSNPYDSSRRQEKSPEPIARETLNENKNDHTRDYLNERSTEISGKNDKVTEPTSPQKDPTVNSAHPHKNVEENQNVDTSSRTRPGSTQTSQTHPRPGVGFNGRAHPSVQGNRQFGGSRLPLRTQPGENSRLGSSVSQPSASSTDSSSSSVSQPVLTSGQRTGSGSPLTKTGGLTGSDSQSTLPSSASSSSFRNGFRGQGGRTRFPGLRGKPNNGGQFKPGNGNGKNGRPNLAAANEKESPTSQGINKAVGQKFITGPDGTKWVVDLELGVLMNQDGKVLQDSQGKPKRVVLGEDGRTIFDLMGSPLLNQEGMALFGHGRDSSPVVNPKDRVLMVGGKPVVGLDLPHLRTTTTTTTTATTTTPEPTTAEWTTEEPTTPPPNPTCPPGTFFKTDEDGYPMFDPEGILDCYPEESSGMEMDHMIAVNMLPDALALKKDEQTTQPPVITTTTTTTTTTAAVTTPELDTRPSNRGPSSAFDLSGKKRFTAPYVNYIQKDPGSPCSLTEALEYLQVDVLEDLMEKDSLKANPNRPPKNKPNNFTVVAMEGCHSFIILDWARPVKDDMVSGYMVYSASYDDVLNNRWSKSTSTGTHLAVENLKPNSRYYFKVQAKNVFGLGPISETLTYVTESDDPLLIERPPGGEPIWIPFSFKYNPAHSSCKGSQYVKRTWYRKFVGVVLCNSLRYKIFMGNGLREPFYSIGDTFGDGEDHCQFVDSYRDGRTGPAYLSSNLPTAQGYYRAYRQEPVTFGVIGRRTAHPFVGWYECGVPIPGKW